MKNIYKFKLLVFLSLVASLISCQKDPEPIPTYNLEVRKADQDTIFVVENTKKSNEIAISYESTLSGIAAIICAPDTMFQNYSGFAVATGSQVKGLFHVAGLKGDLIYIKYMPIADSISGTLKIKVELQ